MRLPHEARRLVDNAAPHITSLVLFSLGCGARMSEAFELEWRDVDLLGGRAILWYTKGKVQTRRNVTLPPVTVGALQDMASERFGNRERAGRVFLRPDGQPYADKERESGGQMKTAWRGAIKRAGLDPALTPHDMRHTWASWHYAMHKDLIRLQLDGKWSTVTLVTRYAHLLPAGHEDAIRAFLDTQWTREAATHTEAA